MEDTHTTDAVIYDPATGQVVMVVTPRDDAALDELAFNPPGLQQRRVPHVAPAITGEPTFDDAVAAQAVVDAVRAIDPSVKPVALVTPAHHQLKDAFDARLAEAAALQRAAEEARAKAAVAVAEEAAQP